MKKIHVTGKGVDPVSNKLANMTFEVEADSKEELTRKTLEGFEDMSGLLHMIHIPLFNFKDGEEDGA